MLFHFLFLNSIASLWVQTCSKPASMRALMGKQKETYNNLIAKGVPLRMVKVKIVSFDANRYLVEQRMFERFV